MDHQLNSEGELDFSVKPDIWEFFLYCFRVCTLICNTFTKFSEKKGYILDLINVLM